MKSLKLLTICGATLMLVACTKDDVTTTASFEELKATQPTPVAFSTYLGESTTTRNLEPAAQGEISPGNFTNRSFGVFAYHTTTAYTAGQTSTMPNFMYNEKVSNSSSTWTYSPIKYWPNDFANGNVDNRNAQGSATNSYLSFFAYAPWTGDEDAGNGGISGVTTGITSITAKNVAEDPKLTFVKGSDPEVDLLWGAAGVESYTNAAGQTTSVSPLSGGVAPVNANLTKLYTEGSVSFAFKHALAKLGNITVDAFADAVNNGSTNSQAIANTTKITVTSVTVSTTAMPTSGTLNLATGVWDYTGASTNTQTYTFDNGTGGTAINSSILEPSSVTAWNDLSSVTGVPAAVSSYTPANLATTFPLITFFPGERPTITVTIVYTVRTEDTALNKGYSEVVQTISNAFQFPSGFAMNTQYNLAIHLGLTSVKFTASVSEWDSSSAAVDLPINVATPPSSGD